MKKSMKGRFSLMILRSFAAILTAAVPFVACNDSFETEVPDGGNSGQTPGTGDGGGEEPEAPEPHFYQEVTASLADWSGDYLICADHSDALIVFADWSDETYGQPAGDDAGNMVDLSVFVTEDGIPAEDGDPYKSVVTAVGDHYSVYVSNVGYIGHSDEGNTLTVTSTAPDGSDGTWLWDLSWNGRMRMTSVADDTRILQWNASHPRFSAYSGSQEDIILYRSDASGSGTVPPDPEEPEEPEEPENPDPDPDPNPGSGKYAWYELPVMKLKESSGYLTEATDPDLYYAYHLCDGNEKGPGGKKARNYTVCFSSEHHCPVWVAAPRHSMYEGSSGRSGYSKDPDIPASIQYNSTKTGGGCNKGHMLGSAERTSSSATNKQVFYYSNIAPQLSSTFNTGGGGWNTLEDWVDTKVCSDTLYVVIGAYFDEFKDNRGYSASPTRISFGGRSDVSRPTMFYYILLRTKRGNTGKALSECTEDELMCAAFVRSHNTPKGTKVDSRDLMSVSDLEEITGFTYFTNVPNAPKDSFNPSDWGL